jgi:hypothetical protein
VACNFAVPAYAEEILFCRYCSAQIAEGAYFCQVCGKDLTDTSAQASPGEIRTSGKAIASLVCGLFLFFPISIAAVVLGHLALAEIRKSAGRLQGHALAVVGLVLGYLGIAFIPVMLIIVAIAIPNLLRARIAANETSASQIVRQLVAAETSFAAEHPEKGYSCDLHDVVSSGDLNSAIATGPRYGYSFALQNCGAPASAPNSKFEVVAYPIRFNQTGRRTFCADQSGVVRSDSSGSAQACLENGSPL